ncbi:hypothetical protein [Chishuiella sp.]|uniref:hypothetical protein n=1 Tax=Chishuiella sp. TaxID=1969467 RepID=UPI0028B0F74F|nr:hypothetical protein [Chishuiella sp.]
MKRNRFFQNIILILFSLFSTFSYSQFTINAYNGGWIPVSSSSGATVSNVGVIQLHLSGPLNYNSWSIVARVTSPIVNSDNKVFPVEKLSFKYNTYSTQQYYAENYPTITQLGVIQNNISMSFSPVYFIKNSPLAITIPSGKYGGIQLSYDVVIEGGNYLNNLKSWNNYPIKLEFNILNEFGTVIATSSYSVEMQISPSGNYDTTPTLAITLSTAAINGELVFNTIQDYKNGVTKEYQDGLNVSSDTPYEIQVASVNEYFQSTSSDNLDLSSIKVQLKDTETGAISNQVNLANYNQTIYSSSTKSTSKNYNIIYSTSAEDQKILNSKSGNYTTSLQYTIIPL